MAHLDLTDDAPVIPEVSDIKMIVNTATRYVNNLRGQVELAFYRGYQKGYQDRVDGKEPKYHARSEVE